MRREIQWNNVKHCLDTSVFIWFGGFAVFYDFQFYLTITVKDFIAILKLKCGHNCIICVFCVLWLFV